MNKVIHITITTILASVVVYLLTRPAPVDVEMLLDNQKKQQRIEADSLRILELERASDSLGVMVEEMEASLGIMLSDTGKIRETYVKKINIVRRLNADSTTLLLSKNLSK